jgi:hypothetical protein
LGLADFVRAVVTGPFVALEFLLLDTAGDEVPIKLDFNLGFP